MSFRDNAEQILIELCSTQFSLAAFSQNACACRSLVAKTSLFTLDHYNQISLRPESGMLFPQKKKERKTYLVDLVNSPASFHAPLLQYWIATFFLSDCASLEKMTQGRQYHRGKSMILLSLFLHKPAESVTLGLRCKRTYKLVCLNNGEGSALKFASALSHNNYVIYLSCFSNRISSVF